MIILSNTTDSLQVVLASAITTSQLKCYVAYRDTTATTITPNRAVANTNSTTPVTLLSAPAASQQKIVDYLSIYNSDTANAVVTVYINSSSTTYKLTETTLGPGEKLEFQEGQGFRSLTANGSLKIGENQGVGSISNQINVVSISADQSIASAAAFTSITGLQFPVVANETYWFKFCIFYTAAGATRSMGVSLTGPAKSYLSYMRIQHSNSNIVFFPSKDYDSVVTPGTTIPGLTLPAIVEGIITPSASGNVIGRAIPSASGATVTVRAGSLVYYQKLS